jgi:hypothetical protein
VSSQGLYLHFEVSPVEFRNQEHNSGEPPPSRRRAPPVSGETAATRSRLPSIAKLMAQISHTPQVKVLCTGQPKPPPTVLLKRPNISFELYAGPTTYKEPYI